MRRELVVVAAALLGTAAGAPARAEGTAGTADKGSTHTVSSAPASPPPVPAGGAQPASTRDAGARPAEAALELFRRANRLYDERNLTEAEKLYRRALELSPTYDIATNLGALELDLGKPAEAAELFAFALRHFPIRGKPADRAGIEARFEAAKMLVCALRVKVDSAGAEILVDGRPAGTAPLAGELFVMPGARKITARQAGRTDAQAVIEARAGGAKEVSLTLAPLAESQGRSSWPGFVTAGAGVLALGVGATLVGMAEASRADARAKRDELAKEGASCAAPSPGCAELRALTSRTDALGNGGLGLLVTGGTLAAVGITYVLWPSPGDGPKTREAPLRASISASPAGGGVTLAGSF